MRLLLNNYSWSSRLVNIICMTALYHLRHFQKTNKQKLSIKVEYTSYKLHWSMTWGWHTQRRNFFLHIPYVAKANHVISLKGLIEWASPLVIPTSVHIWLWTVNGHLMDMFREELMRAQSSCQSCLMSFSKDI